MNLEEESKTRGKKWKVLTKDDIKRWLGLEVYMGVDYSLAVRVVGEKVLVFSRGQS
jgi:hypothetical protein